MIVQHQRFTRHGQRPSQLLAQFLKGPARAIHTSLFRSVPDGVAKCCNCNLHLRCDGDACVVLISLSPSLSLSLCFSFAPSLSLSLFLSLSFFLSLFPFPSLKDYIGT